MNGVPQNLSLWWMLSALGHMRHHATKWLLCMYFYHTTAYAYKDVYTFCYTHHRMLKALTHARRLGFSDAT